MSYVVCAVSFLGVSFQVGLSAVSFIPRGSIKGCRCYPSRGSGLPFYDWFVNLSS